MGKWSFLWIVVASMPALAYTGDAGYGHALVMAQSEQGLSRVANPPTEPEPGMLPVPSGRLGGLIKFAGKFHVIVVHFPIALILTVALTELLQLATKRPFFADSARYLIILATASVLVTVPLGWAAGADQNYAGDYVRVFWFHAAFGASTGILVLSSAAACVAAAKTGKRVMYRVYYLTLALATILVALAGHFGAMLVQGLDYFK